MKRLLIFFVLFFFVSVSLASSTEVITYNPDQIDHSSFVGYHPKKIVVKFDPAIMSRMNKRGFAKGKTGVPTLDLIGERFKVRVIQKQFRTAKINKSQRRAIDLSGWHKLKFDNDIDVLSVVEQYKVIPGVIHAEPVSIHKIYADPEPRVPVEEFFSDKYSWHLNKINAPMAWNYETGNNNVIVAILDTGVRYFHGDLGGSGASYYNPTNVSGNMWVNSAEKNGTPGVDEDGNGYIDDWIGYDFVEDVSALGAPCAQQEDCNVSDNDPRDFNGHGTHCAGLVAAITNNNYGIASVAGGWGDGSHELQPSEPGVKIMALRVGWSDEPMYPCWLVGYYPMAGYVEMDYAAEALVYAAYNGARIASCSWGSENAGGIYDAIAYFIASGGLIFKAAGNASSSIPDFMENLPVHPDLGDLNPYVISVAATDKNDCKASFSSYGDWVDISAPGEETPDPFDSGTGIWSLLHNNCDPAGEYITHMEGTSMATPLAAAVAALIWSQNPGWTADQVVQKIYDSADDIYGLSCNSSYAGKLGAGRVNAFNAVKIDCVDVDEDGFTICDGDCDDNNIEVHPGATETCSDDLDNDCDGVTDCYDNDCSDDPACQQNTCNNNGICETSEDCNNCPDDCISGGGVAFCGNGVCEPSLFEDCLSCPGDCAGKQGGKPSKRFCCGNGGGYNPVNCDDSRCTSDGYSCGDTPDHFCCGDGACEGDEDSNNCAVDCGLPPAPECGNKICEAGENSTNCPNDCEPPICGKTGDSCTLKSDCCSNKCVKGVCK